MKVVTGVVLVQLLLAGGALPGREIPYVKDVSVTVIPSTDESLPMQRRRIEATLVNAHATPLTAWALDLIDREGRTVSRDIVDYAEIPSEFLPSRGERKVEAGWMSRGGSPAAPPVALVFHAGIDSKDRGVGDPETVERMRNKRASRDRPTDKPRVK